MNSSSPDLNHDGHNDDDDHPVDSSQLKLFGFSLNPIINHHQNMTSDATSFSTIPNSITMLDKQNKKCKKIIKPSKFPPPPLSSSSSSRFKCEFCGQEFVNLQALGGHQNAHKAERRLSRLNYYKAAHHQYSQHLQNYNNIALMPRNHLITRGQIIHLASPRFSDPRVIVRGSPSMAVFGGSSTSGGGYYNGTTVDQTRVNYYHHVNEHQGHDIDLELRLAPLNPPE